MDVASLLMDLYLIHFYTFIGDRSNTITASHPQMVPFFFPLFSSIPVPIRVFSSSVLVPVPIIVPILVLVPVLRIHLGILLLSLFFVTVTLSVLVPLSIHVSR